MTRTSQWDDSIIFSIFKSLLNFVKFGRFIIFAHVKTQEAIMRNKETKLFGKRDQFKSEFQSLLLLVFSTTRTDQREQIEIFEMLYIFLRQ